METIGSRIKKARKTLGITQEQFGKLAGVSKGAVSQWENDLTSPDLKAVMALSASGIDIGVLPPDPNTATGPPLTHRQQALLGLFDGLTETQQDELIRSAETTERANREVLEQLASRQGKGRAK